MLHHVHTDKANGEVNRELLSAVPSVLWAVKGANLMLRQPMVFLNIYMMQQPEAYIGNSWELFDEQNNLKNEDTRTFLQNWINAFAEWVYKF